MSTFSALFLPEKFHFVHPAKNRTPLYVSNAQKQLCTLLFFILFFALFSTVFQLIFQRFSRLFPAQIQPGFSFFFSKIAPAKICFPYPFQPPFFAPKSAFFRPDSDTIFAAFSHLNQHFFTLFSAQKPHFSHRFYPQKNRQFCKCLQKVYNYIRYPNNYEQKFSAHCLQHAPDTV